MGRNFIADDTALCYRTRVHKCSASTSIFKPNCHGKWSGPKMTSGCLKDIWTHRNWDWVLLPDEGVMKTKPLWWLWVAVVGLNSQMLLDYHLQIFSKGEILCPRPRPQVGEETWSSTCYTALRASPGGSRADQGAPAISKQLNYWQDGR